KKAHSGMGLLQMADAGPGLLVLDRNPEPDVRRCRPVSVPIVDEFLQQRAALREDLIDVPVGALHGVEDLGDMRFRHRLMEKIAHRVDEYHPGLFPIERLREALGPDGEIEAVLERMTRDTAEAFGKTGGVAVIASGADLGAAGDRVPG